tara:strand:+ start:1465 stop:1632 length:168 start_codon:yes stop_codon:yes gene_type:complete
MMSKTIMTIKIVFIANKRNITALDGINTWPVNVSHVDVIRKIARNKIKILNKDSL